MEEKFSLLGKNEKPPAGGVSSGPKEKGDKKKKKESKGEAKKEKEKGKDKAKDKESKKPKDKKAEQLWKVGGSFPINPN